MYPLDDVIKAYDVRGTVPNQISPEFAYSFGGAFVRVIGAAARDGGAGCVVVGHDMRDSGPALVAAFTAGVIDQGCDVLQIGLCSTDGLYYASGSEGLAGAMFTASHNPADYNGIKLCRAGAAPVARDTGLAAIKQMIIEGIPRYDGAEGYVRTSDMLDSYATYLRHLVDTEEMRPLKVVIDAGNGMAGYTAPAVLGPLSLEIVPLYFELDCTFPNHQPNPSDPATLRDLQAAVVANRADLGFAFDGDTDRCFVVDERGEIVDPSVLTALIATLELAKAPGSPVIHSLAVSRAVPEIVAEQGGIPVRTRVGHSFIKATMAETGAVFGGEHTGHFYFRDFWRADSGMLAALHVLSFLGKTPLGSTLSAELVPFTRYHRSGEINYPVRDVDVDVTESIAAVRAAFEHREAVSVDTLDGLTLTTPTWSVNLRPSNTEPLLRLNVEAEREEDMKQIRDDVLSVIERSDS